MQLVCDLPWNCDSLRKTINELCRVGVDIIEELLGCNHIYQPEEWSVDVRKIEMKRAYFTL